MPQSTNLNTPPYFEDFDPDKNFHKVLFRPGYPLQARELTTLQSILQDQSEKFGSSIYADGAMVIPGRVLGNYLVPCVLIEDEYFGISANDLTEHLVGKIIIGASSGIRAKVTNVLTSDQSEKESTTLYLNYLSTATDNVSDTFEDDEVLITESAFSIGNTVIQENTDFAKCVSADANYIGSTASITDGVYFAKGFFIKVKSQSIILDQYSNKPSYKVGLQILEEIAVPEDDISLNDPSQGYSNYSAPGAHRFKLTAVLTKKSIDDSSVTDFIELLRVKEGKVIEILNDSKKQLAKTFDQTFARRTYDESGDYVVTEFKFTRNECLNTGLNNGIFTINSLTSQRATPSKDLITLSSTPGKAYVRGYEIDKIGTSFVDVKKPRETDSKNNLTIRTDGRGVEFRSTTGIPYSRVAASFGQVVSVHNSSDTVIGYGIFKSYEEGASYNIIRLSNIQFVNSGTTIIDIVKIRFGGTINYSTNTSSGGTLISLSAITGQARSYLFRAFNSVVKSISDTKVQNVLTYFSDTVGAANTITISNRNYYSTSVSDYTLKIEGDPAVNISVANIDSSGTLTLGLSGAVAQGTSYILVGPEKIDNPTLKLASHQKMRVAKLTDIAGKYSVNNTRLYFGTTRVSKIHAVYNVKGTYSSPEDILPKLTLVAGSGNFEIGEVLIGRTTNSKARVIKQVGNSLYFTYETPSNFVANETLFGYSKGVERTIETVDENGLPNIKSRYILDDGQRTQAFEYSSVRKLSSESSISGELFVVFDYFKDDVSSGQFYTVNSYYDADFDDIPSFKTTGTELYLSDFIDWRTNRDSVFLSSSTGEYNNPFTLDSSKLTSGSTLGNYGGTTTNTYQTSSNFILPVGTTDGDVEFYLARQDNLYLGYDGKFIVQEGTPSLNPSLPSQELSGALKLLTIKMPAYLRDINNVTIDVFDNRRFTMRDIGLLEKRITNIEYYTTLSLLETDTSNLFIDDGTGGNRLKNGFVVDNFLNHSVGDPTQPNYACSLDMNRGHLRPQHYTTNVRLDQSEIPSRYIKGRYIMLDYDNELFMEQPYAAIVENVNPFAVVTWQGIIELSPESDDWFEETRIPDSVTDVEGNYTALIESMGGDPNTGLIPSQWGAWTETRRTNWNTGWQAGYDTDLIRLETNFTATEEFDRQIVNDRLVSEQFAPWTRSRNITCTATALKPSIQMYGFFGNREVSAFCTPKITKIAMNSGSVAFQAGEDIIISTQGRKFRARLLPAGDIEFSNYDFITSSYTSSSTYLNIDIESMEELAGSDYGGYLLSGDIVIGSNSGAAASITSTALICDRSGSIALSFFIPDPNDDSNPRWPGGSTTFTLTGDAQNTQISGINDSSADATYSSVGTLYTRQFEVENIRNVSIERTIGEIDANTVRTVTWTRPPAPPGDPLAQSFQLSEEEGIFITQIDVFFQSKDANLPLKFEIRNMLNGYPGPTVLERVNLNPDQVNISEDASVPTSCIFESPVYLPPGAEYCFVVLTASTEYKLWISETGKNDLNGEKITKQPSLGVLFKSQNNSTWTAHQLQDIKFRMYRAKFKINETPTITLSNDNSANSQFTRLVRDPIELNVNNGRIKVHHRNHGHHDNSSYIELKGVTSEQYAALSANFSGTPGQTMKLKGNRDTFASLDNINGAAPSGTNPAYVKLGDVIYTYDPNAVGVADGQGNFDLLTIDLVSGSIPSDGFKANDSWIAEHYIIDGVPLTLINTVHTQLEWITLDSYQINLSGVTRNTAGNTTVGGENVFASQNITYTQFVPSVEYREYPGTTLRSSFSSTSGTSIGNSSFSDPASTSTPSQPSYLKQSAFIPVDLNNDNTFNTPRVIASAINEDRQMIGAKSAELRLTLASNNDSLSPLIYKDRISLTTTANRIGNFDGTIKNAYFEDDDSGSYDIGSSSTNDYNAANYITKLFSLANESTSLRIEFAALNTSETDLDVYVKLLSGDETNPNEVDWIEITDTNYAQRKNELRFVDYSYNYTASDTFTQYQVKIRMRSTNQAVVPIVKDFRVIALA